MYSLKFDIRQVYPMHLWSNFFYQYGAHAFISVNYNSHVFACTYLGLLYLVKLVPKIAANEH